MKKYVTEFIGTFFLVFVIVITATQGIAIAPIAIGAILMVMVYMGAHVSGAHYNPAVSLGLFLKKKLSIADLAAYWASQILGAAAAAAASYAILETTFAPAPDLARHPWQALTVEAIFTFALVLVIMNVAIAARTEGNQFYGLAIGFTIAAAAFAGGGISGGAFNPAVGLGPTIVDAFVSGGTWEHVWLYIVGPLAGGAFAALVFSMQEAGEN